jgi:hypothetical protein
MRNRIAVRGEGVRGATDARDADPHATATDPSEILRSRHPESRAHGAENETVEDPWQTNDLAIP